MVVAGTIGRAVLVVAAMVLSAGPLAAGEPTCVIAYDADRVTVHAKRAPLADVVREIGRQSGAEIVGDVRKPRDVSQDFERVPLVDALVRLLREQNFTLRYGPEGKLRTIGLLDAGRWGQPGQTGIGAAAPASWRATVARDASGWAGARDGCGHGHGRRHESSRREIAGSARRALRAGRDDAGAVEPEQLAGARRARPKAPSQPSRSACSDGRSPSHRILCDAGGSTRPGALGGLRC